MHFQHLQKPTKTINQDHTISKKSISFIFHQYPNLQPKLKISQPGDIYEQEADRISGQIMQISYTQVNRKCTSCEKDEEEGMKISRKISNEITVETSEEVTNEINNIRGRGGSPLDTTTRGFMESRFGFDFSKVRIHTGDMAAKSAESVNARAYTVGNDIVFGNGEYSPQTQTGRQILAHELVHVVQQHDHDSELGLFRLSPAMCAFGSMCNPPDVKGSGTATSWKLTLAVDREEEGLGRLISGNVGHTWVKLSNNVGEKYSYGFWPQVGFSSSNPIKSVTGCIHHPDTAHEPPSATNYISVDYTINSVSYSNALSYAQRICKSTPDYNLATYNCTTFAIEMAKAAGISPPSSTTLAIHNPNALYEGIEEELKTHGTTGGGSKGTGSKGKKTP